METRTALASKAFLASTDAINIGAIAWTKNYL